MLEEADRLFTCGHCRVRLYLAAGRVAKYFLPPHSSLRMEDLFFVPYWHLRGAHYSVHISATKSTFLDTSCLASSAPGLPVTLGVRAQAMAMRIAAEGVAGSFVRPTLAYDDMLSRTERTVRSFSGAGRRAGAYLTAFVGEAVSLIYTPVLPAARGLVDAVLNRPFAGSRTVSPEDFGPLEETGSRAVSFLPAICPECGWDMPGERRSQVLLCTNCDRAWQVEGGRFVPLSFVSMEGGGEEALPFWRVEVGIDGMKLDSYADLAELANLPRAVREEWQRRRPAFWAPAFRSRPRLFLRLARQLTVLAPKERSMAPRVPPGKIHPVTIDHEAALESVRLTLAELAVPRKDVLPLLDGVKIKLLDRRLVYLPFTARGGDLTHEALGVSMRRNALRG
jgi:hypothetical protein